MSNIAYFCRPATNEETAITLHHLRAHTEAATGIRVTHEPFSVTAYEGDRLIGSVIGKIYSGWLHLDLVWVNEEHRKQGIGRGLIENCIAEAAKRGLSGIEVWTQSWQSPHFYERVGFREYARLDDFLPGRHRHVFQYILKDHRP